MSASSCLPSLFAARRPGSCRRGRCESEQGREANLLHDCVCTRLNPPVPVCWGRQQRIRDGMANTNDRIRIWDLPVRLFHWALVILMATSYFSGQAGGDWMKLHFWSGYAILTLLLFRIVWGFVGSTTARFSHFVKGPAAAFRHIAELAGA